MDLTYSLYMKENKINIKLMDSGNILSLLNMERVWTIDVVEFCEFSSTWRAVDNINEQPSLLSQEASRQIAIPILLACSPICQPHLAAKL